MTYTDGEIRIYPDYSDNVLYKYEAVDSINNYFDICLDKYHSDLFVGNEETFVLRNLTSVDYREKQERNA